MGTGNKQVKFWCNGTKEVKGGIRLDDGRLLCGCCGEILSEDEFIILEEYNNWVDLSEEIAEI